MKPINVAPHYHVEEQKDMVHELDPVANLAYKEITDDYYER